MEDGGVLFSGLLYGLHKNGNIAYYQFIENGVGHGLHVRFYPNGQIELYQIQIKGGPVGKFYYWYENGALKDEYDYYDNYVIHTSVSYDENGKPVFVSVGNFISLDTAVKIVMEFTDNKSHIPIPTRIADAKTREERAKLI